MVNKSIKILLILTLISVIPIIYNGNKQHLKPHQLQWWLTSINVEKMRDIATGKNVKIAVIDTGIDKNHPDLRNSVIEDHVILKNSNKSKLEHGTMVAGIISAKPYTKEGIAGVAPNAEILSINILDNRSNITIENLIKAINYAIDIEVDIINMSLGVEEYSQQLHSVIKRAYLQDIILIAATGSNSNTLYPAKFKEVISVGSYDKTNTLISEQLYEQTDVFAPGENIMTTYSDLNNIDKEYMSVNGSSFSTAIVTGSVALVKEINTNIKPIDLLNYFNENKKHLDTEKLVQEFKY